MLGASRSDTASSTRRDRVHRPKAADLYAYAARVVGTRASRDAERSRTDRCLNWMRANGGRVPIGVRLRPRALAGCLAANFAIGDERGDAQFEALCLVDELIALGDGGPAVPADPGELERSNALGSCG